MERMSENEKNETQPPLTIAMVVDTSGNRGNGTSNSALQLSLRHISEPTSLQLISYAVF